MDVAVLTWVRWVLVHKRAQGGPSPVASIPTLPAVVDAASLVVPDYGRWVARIATVTGSDDYWEDYDPGEQIHHLSGMTINDSDHSIATRLYQNTAKAHFDAELMKATPGGKRLVYGGHVISVCRALAYDGLENAIGLLAINAGTHVAPTYAGDTLRCVTVVKERIATRAPACRGVAAAHRRGQERRGIVGDRRSGGVRRGAPVFSRHRARPRLHGRRTPEAP